MAPWTRQGQGFLPFSSPITWESEPLPALSPASYPGAVRMIASACWDVEEWSQNPNADPKHLAEIVSSAPARTQHSLESVGNLITRFGEIAARFADGYPLHERMFMQWSHHARPRDTHFPTCWKISSRTQDGWINMHNELDDVLATGAEKARHAASHAHDLAILGPLPWSKIEELAALHNPMQRRRAGAICCQS